MGYSPLRRVLKIKDDRMLVCYEHPEPPVQDTPEITTLDLYVNGNGSLLALTPEQVRQQHSLANGNHTTS